MNPERSRVLSWESDPEALSPETTELGLSEIPSPLGPKTKSFANPGKALVPPWLPEPGSLGPVAIETLLLVEEAQSDARATELTTDWTKLIGTSVLHLLATERCNCLAVVARFRFGSTVSWGEGLTVVSVGTGVV